MSCPNCDHTMQNIWTGPSMWWCPRCGTTKNSLGVIHTPSMVEDYQRLVRKVDHGCTDQCCSDCDPVSRPEDPLTFDEVESELNAAGMGVPADLDELDRILRNK